MTIVYNQFFKKLLSSDIDLITDEIRVMLLSEYYSPEASDTFFDIKPFEISSPNYTPGGNVLSIDMVGDKQIHSAKVRWLQLTAEIKHIVVYKDCEEPVPVMCQSFDGLQVLRGNNFAIEWDDFLLAISQGEDSAPIENSGLLGSAILGKMTLGASVSEEG